MQWRKLRGSWAPPAGEGRPQVDREVFRFSKDGRGASGLSRPCGTSLESVHGKFTGNLAPRLARLLCLLVTAARSTNPGLSHILSKDGVSSPPSPRPD